MKENFDIIQNMFGEEPIKGNESDPFRSSVVCYSNDLKFYSLILTTSTAGRYMIEKKSQVLSPESHSQMVRRERLY